MGQINNNSWIEFLYNFDWRSCQTFVSILGVKNDWRKWQDRT